jgi:hypothetical protein
VSYRYTGEPGRNYPSLGIYNLQPDDVLETRPLDDGRWAESAPSQDVNVETTVDVPAPIESEKDTNEAVPADEELK